MNKVLCVTAENQIKANRTPREYLGGTPRWAALEAFAGRLPPRKAERLLIEDFDDKEKDWKSRAMNDTRYMARLLRAHIEESLNLGEGNRVQCRNGSLTGRLRAAWGFPDKNRRNDRHHAVDAIVLACSTQGMVQKMANWDRMEARKRDPDKRPLPPRPWESFRSDAMEAVHGPRGEDGKRHGGIFVTRMPVRKVTGPAHEETIRSIRETAEGERRIIQRVKLRSLTPAMLENLVDRERNIRLYTLLKSRLDAHDGKPDKAFAEPVCMPVNTPSKTAPEIHSVRVVTNEKSGVPINRGLASNGDMVRVDVFSRAGKFYLVPVYVHHFAGDALPCRAITIGKPEEQWTPMEESEFLFSLYRNELVRIQSKKEDVLGYYVGTDRSNGSIHLRAHDNDPGFGKEGLMRGIGVKTLLAFEKYAVDIFGNMRRIERETRLGLAQCDDPEPGTPFPAPGTAEAG